MRNKGLTLIELLIVLAIIAIISAILIPTFTNFSAKARLQSDIRSGRAIHSAIELYTAEQARSLTSMTIDGIITELDEKGYIKAADAVIQTESAKWETDSEKGIVVNVSACGVDIRNRAYNQLSDQEKQFVKGGGG